jgi:hypothetical protein
MRKSLLLILLLVNVFVLTGSPLKQRPQLQSVPVPVKMALPNPSGLIVRTSSFIGADTGARINAADKSLGARVGWIIVDTPGEIRTQVRISRGHKLKFGKGRFPGLGFSRDASMIVMDDDTELYGSGMNETVLVESPESYIVIAARGALESEGGHLGTAITKNLKLAGFRIEGANMKAEGGVRSTIHLGNAHNVYIYNVNLRDTTCLGISAGGNSRTGKHGDGWLVEHCLFEGVASQTLNAVNAENVVFRKNIFLRTGKLCEGGKPCEGVSAIDIEPNTWEDRVTNVTIEDNHIDSTDSPFLHGNGIVVQNGAKCEAFGQIIVRRNRIIGNPLGGRPLSNLTGGIFIFRAQDVQVLDNIIHRAAHHGIYTEGSSRLLIERNTIISAGTGGISSFQVNSTTDSRFAFNILKPDPANPLYGLTEIKETWNSNRNVYEGNEAKVFLVGKESRIIGPESMSPTSRQ